MRKIDGLVGLLGLLGALDGLSPAKMFLASKKLVPISEDPGAVEQFEKFRDAISKLDVSTVDAVSVMILHRPTAEVPCACGEIHEGLTVTTNVIGDITTLKAMLSIQAEDLEKHS